MRKRYRIALAVLVAAIVGVVVWQALRSQEPDLSIQGKPLTTWVEGYGSGMGNARGRAEADEILNEVGTNAIPTLLRMRRLVWGAGAGEGQFIFNGLSGVGLMSRFQRCGQEGLLLVRAAPLKTIIFLGLAPPGGGPIECRI